MLQKTSFTACVTNLSGMGQAGPDVNLTWTGIPAATGGYTVQRSTTNGGPYTTVGSTASNVTSFTDNGTTNSAPNGLTGGDTYYYVVSAE